ncbi:MAG: hypothetical protein HKN09_01065, partial [Saprospiraceae bacterium]|nr:hypothetical protein [Saprospiraceae bacterium]
MKTSILFLSAIFILNIGHLNSQCNPSSDDGKSIRFENNHRTFKTYYGGILENAAEYPGDLTYNDGIGNPIFDLGYTKSIWIAGTDPSGNLKTSAVTFRGDVLNDFAPGPFSINPDESDAYCNYWYRTWKVEKADLSLLKDLFDANQLLDPSQVPDDILEWPAKGNPWIDNISIDQDLAPFKDLNNDGIYNPMDGDSPIVYQDTPEFIPYVFGFRVFNDYKLHTATNNIAVDVEVHHMFYLRNCPDLDPSNHSVFHKLSITNKGTSDIINTRIGLFEDQDLG